MVVQFGLGACHGGVHQMGPQTSTVVGDIEITLDDVHAIQAALLEHLAKSTYEDRDDLLRRTSGASGEIDAAGTVRIGAWLLGVDDRDRVFLRLREAPGQFVAKAHIAYLARTHGAWRVTDLRAEHIRVRPVTPLQ